MLFEGFGNNELYKNQQKEHFHNKVIREFIEGKKVVDATVTEEDRSRQRG